MYQHLFFDLDHTLWDFEANSRLTLQEIHAHFNLENYSISLPDFISKYEINNARMWNDYRNGKMSQETLRVERFRQTLSQLGVKNKELSHEIALYYVFHSPKKTQLLPNTIEVLNYLMPKYKLHIITNGFEEVQYQKLENSKLSAYFDVIVTSEQSGAKKPHPSIFKYALKCANTNAQYAAMIGDNQRIDIEGAQKIGMDGVLFNPNMEELVVQPKFHVRQLAELKNIF